MEKRNMPKQLKNMLPLVMTFVVAQIHANTMTSVSHVLIIALFCTFFLLFLPMS